MQAIISLFAGRTGDPAALQIGSGDPTSSEFGWVGQHTRALDISPFGEIFHWTGPLRRKRLKRGALMKSVFSVHLCVYGIHFGEIVAAESTEGAAQAVLARYPGAFIIHIEAKHTLEPVAV